MAGDDASLRDAAYALLGGSNVTGADGAPEDLALELQAGAPFQGIHAEPDLGELTRAAGLLLVTIFRFAPALDRLAVFYARRFEVHMDVVSAAQAVGNDFEVQLTLRRKNGLVQFAVHDVEEGRVFLV